jgi:hypothetical protein
MNDVERPVICKTGERRSLTTAEGPLTVPISGTRLRVSALDWRVRPHATN